MCGLKHRRRSAAWTILLDWMSRSRKRASALWMMRARSCGKRGWQVNLQLCCSFDEHHLSLQASWAGSWTAVAVALQRSRRCGLASDLCRDTTHAGRAEGTDQQDGPQRCARHSTDDAGRALSTGACEDVAQPEASNAHDPSQATSVEGHRH